MFIFYGAFILILLPALLTCYFSQSFKKPFFLTFIFLTLVIFIYAFSGDFKNLQAFYQEEEKQKTSQALLKTVKSPQDLIVKMEAVLKEHPNSAKGWFLLGRLYSSQGDIVKGIMAFKKSYAFSPNFETALQWVMLLTQRDDKIYTDETKEKILFFSKRYPEHPEWYVFLANVEKQNKNPESAIAYYRLLQGKVKDPSLLSAIKEEIRDLQMKYHLGFRLPLDIPKNPSWEKRFSKNATVFIVLKYEKEQRMPIAAIKKHLSDLPLKMVLTEADFLNSQEVISKNADLILKIKITESAVVRESKEDLVIVRKIVTPQHFILN